jgi:hypothetical protein
LQNATSDSAQAAVATDQAINRSVTVLCIGRSSHSANMFVSLIKSRRPAAAAGILFSLATLIVTCAAMPPSFHFYNDDDRADSVKRTECAERRGSVSIRSSVVAASPVSLSTTTKTTAIRSCPDAVSETRTSSPARRRPTVAPPHRRCAPCSRTRTVSATVCRTKLDSELTST